MPSLPEYAILSAAVYQDARGDDNKNPLPPGWSKIGDVSNATGGLSGFLSSTLSILKSRS
jgi:hypothetical protein